MPRKPKAAAAESEEKFTPPAGVPVRLITHDWPFLYSVTAQGLVINKRVASPTSSKAAEAKRKPVSPP